MASTDADLASGPDQVLRVLAAVEDGWDVALGDRGHPESRMLVAPPRLRSVAVPPPPPALAAGSLAAGALSSGSSLPSLPPSDWQAARTSISTTRMALHRMYFCIPVFSSIGARGQPRMRGPGSSPALMALRTTTSSRGLAEAAQ